MTDGCFYYRQARREKEAEREEGGEREGTSLGFYYEKGCLNGCDGNDKNCSSYIFIRRAGGSIKE